MTIIFPIILVMKKKLTVIVLINNILSFYFANMLKRLYICTNNILLMLYKIF